MSDDYDDECCYECGGEGFVSDCVEEWACVDPEYGCDYCTRRCPLCNPPKRNPELDAVLAGALATPPADQPGGLNNSREQFCLAALSPPASEEEAGR